MQQDRVVVITGAAGGRGSVLVGRFLANGDTVIATDTKEEALAELRRAPEGLHRLPDACRLIAAFSGRV